MNVHTRESSLLPNRSMFIFGSGTSPAPRVTELTERVLTASMYRGSDGIFYRGNDGGHLKQEAGDDQTIIRYYLTSIRNDIARYWKKDRSEISYEDIANICVHLNKETGSGRNASLHPYRKKLSKQLSSKFPSFQAKRGDLGSLAWAAMDWIAWAIYREFQDCEARPIALKRFTKSLVAKAPSPTIVTLNHDVYLESILRSQANLGFRKRGSGVELFDPDSLSTRRGIPVLKLHGSVDWFWHSESRKYQRLRRFNSLKIDTPPSILAGTSSKLEDYNFSVFPWLWAEFQNTLRKTRRIVVCGYGFHDVGLNTRLSNWLLMYPSARILVLHPDPLGLVTRTRKASIDTIATFFPAETTVIPSPSSSCPKSNSQISIAKVSFEDASNEEWRSWILNFFG